MRREPVCASKWRGKEIVYLAHFPRRSAQKHHYTRTPNANRFKIFHHVDLPDYLISTSFPGSLEREKRDPGCSWPGATQNLGGDKKFVEGRAA